MNVDKLVFQRKGKDKKEMGKKKKETVPETTEVEISEIDGVVEAVENPSEFFEGFDMLTTMQLKEAGHGIKGVYKGPGGILELGTESEKHEVETHLIETQGGMTVRLMGATVMNRELESISIGDEVAILRGPTVKAGKGQLTHYRVAVKKK